jgi:hypothetical protein
VGPIDSQCQNHNNEKEVIRYINICTRLYTLHISSNQTPTTRAQLTFLGAANALRFSSRTRGEHHVAELPAPLALARPGKLLPAPETTAGCHRPSAEQGRRCSQTAWLLATQLMTRRAPRWTPRRPTRPSPPATTGPAGGTRRRT